MKNNFLILIILSISIPLVSCNKLQINQFPNENNPETNNYLTHNYNYQRNTISYEEIIPPLELTFIDDYKGLPSGSFSFVDSILFFCTGKGYITALNVNTYKEMGEKKFGLSSRTPPTIYKSILYQTYDNGDYGLIAYDILEGDYLWEIEDNLTSSSPIVVEKKVFLQSNNGFIRCLNYFDGEEIWKTKLDCFGINSIAYDKGIIISTNQDGAVFALEYSSGIILWKKNLKDKIFADPVISNKHIYLATYNGYLHKLNIKNGEFLQSWNLKTPLYFGPTIDEHNIYIPLSNGEIKSLNKSEYFENWTNRGIGPAASPVVVSENYIYFPTLGKFLYILDKQTGEKLQEIKLEGRARSVPLITNSKLLIACENENVNIFAISE